MATAKARAKERDHDDDTGPAIRDKEAAVGEDEPRGYAGARVSGGAIWLKNRVEFESFAEYEERLNDLLKDHRIVCLCNYALRKSEAVDVLEVVHSHGSAVARRRGDWQVVEAASLKAAKEELRRA